MDAKERKNLLVFGYGLSVIILFIVGRLAFKHHALTTGKKGAILVAVLLAIVTAFKLEWLRPVYKIWMKGAKFIGEIVTFIILTVIFYGIFSPVGIILRVIRKDLLDEKVDKTLASYWKDCQNRAFDRDQVKNQF